MMFLGQYQHALDSKGRLTIPAKFRDELGEAFVCTQGLDNCIFLYPMEEWQRLADKLRNLPFTSGDVRSFERFFFSGAAELETDKTGRTVLPLHLREYAGIDKDLLIVGVGARVEIWSVQNWARYNQATASTVARIADGLGI